jgi:hypothetical protein
MGGPIANMLEGDLVTSPGVGQDRIPRDILAKFFDEL